MSRQNLLLILILHIALFISLAYNNLVLQQKNHLLKSTKLQPNISCHYENEEDALPSAEDKSFSPPEDSIFFHETSCRGVLNPRMACAVESAARAHPHRQVYVLFSAPINDFALTQSCLATLKNFSNVNFARVHIIEYAKGTVLEEMIARRDNYKSMWPIEHTSDILRFLTMYKWGGLYLDTDMIVMKPYDSLGKNWAAKQREDLINAAAFAIGKDELGRMVINRILNDTSINFSPCCWENNGPGAITRALLNLCNATDVSELFAKRCHGFKILRSQEILVLDYENLQYLSDIIEPQDYYDFENYSVHLYNRLTNNNKYENGSLMDNLARQYCPQMYSKYKHFIIQAQDDYKISYW